MPSLFSRSHQAPKKDRTPAVLVANSGQDRKVLGLAKTWNGSSAAPNSSSVGEFGTVPQQYVWLRALPAVVVPAQREQAHSIALPPTMGRPSPERPTA